MADGLWADRAVRRQLEVPSLTLERERELLRVARGATATSAQQDAFRDLWEAHSKQVVAIANRYRRPDIDVLDLIGAGHLGLHEAISRFDLSRTDIRLSTYAAIWIRWYVVDHIRRNSTPVRLPSSTAHRQLAHMTARLSADARRQCERENVLPTEVAIAERIASRIGLPTDEVRSSLRLISGGSVSLHKADDETTTPALEETLSDPGVAPEDDIILRLDHAKLRSRVVALTDEILGERERLVFHARYLTEHGNLVRLETLAARLGVSRERIYQLEVSARTKIGTALAREGYGDILNRRDFPAMTRPRARPRIGSPAFDKVRTAAAG